MLEGGARVALAAVLLLAAALKLRGPRSSQAALGSFGVSRSSTRWGVWMLIVGTELVLAAGVALGSDAASYTAAGLLCAFAGVLLWALARGRAGAPCACFGSRSRISRMSVARNLLLSVAFAALPPIPDGEPTPIEWLTLGLGVALVAVAGLTVALLALAREVGMLRLRLPPQSALEIPEEGPELGSHTELVARFELGDVTELALAVFTSEGCRVCRALEPALATLAGDPLVALRTFEEQRDAEVWRKLQIPGSPFALVLDPGGTVLSKGTFNTLGQLEGLLGTAERRQRETVRG